MAQHPAGQVDAQRHPAQLAYPVGVHPGAAADLQTRATAGAEQVGQGAVDAQRVGVRYARLSGAKELLYLDKPRELARYQFILRDIEQRSLDRRRSRDLIATTAKEL